MPCSAGALAPAWPGCLLHGWAGTIRSCCTPGRCPPQCIHTPNLSPRQGQQRRGQTLLALGPTARYKGCRSRGCAPGVRLGCPTLSHDPRSSTRAVKLRGVMSPSLEVPLGWAGRSLSIPWARPAPRARSPQPGQSIPGEGGQGQQRWDALKGGSQGCAANADVPASASPCACPPAPRRVLSSGWHQQGKQPPAPKINAMIRCMMPR